VSPNRIDPGPSSQYLDVEAPSSSTSEANKSDTPNIYRYGSEPPVQEFGQHEVESVIDAFQASVKTFKANHAVQPTDDELEAGIGHDTPKTEETNRWNENASSAVSVAEDIRDHVNEDNNVYLKYNLGGHTAAVASYSPGGGENGETTINSLAAHPGTAGGASTLVEEIANRTNGAIGVHSLKAAEPFYQSVGFTRDNTNTHGDMTLDPRASDKWITLNDNSVSLKKLKDSKYLVPEAPLQTPNVGSEMEEDQGEPKSERSSAEPVEIGVKRSIDEVPEPESPPNKHQRITQ
jgi:hypothetical protein